ncbi:hypothetical protein FACS1894141_2430 [Spirochaetia bacterium]|nr:hypothetical protein FACS1894141_2430 [Spirochaetia bacterium]
MEHVVFRSVRNTAGFIKSASRSIITIGTDPRARQRIRDLGTIVREQAAGLKPVSRPPSDSADTPVPAQRSGRPGTALVLGNEETGLPQAVKDACSTLVRIPGTGIIESLNVAQAATLFLHELYEI